MFGEKIVCCIRRRSYLLYFSCYCKLQLQSKKRSFYA